MRRLLSFLCLFLELLAATSLTTLPKDSPVTEKTVAPHAHAVLSSAHPPGNAVAPHAHPASSSAHPPGLGVNGAPFKALSVKRKQEESPASKNHKAINSRAFAQVTSNGDVAARTEAPMDHDVAAEVPNTMASLAALSLVRSAKRVPETVTESGEDRSSSDRVSREITDRGEVHTLETIPDAGWEMLEQDPKSRFEPSSDNKDGGSEKTSTRRRKKKKKEKTKCSDGWGSSCWYYDLSVGKRIGLWVGGAASFLGLTGVIHLLTYVPREG